MALSEQMEYSYCIFAFLYFPNILRCKYMLCFFLFSFFPFIFISWRLITLQYCSGGFCHTLTWISHGFACIPHPNPPSHLPLHPIPLGLPSALAMLCFKKITERRKEWRRKGRKIVSYLFCRHFLYYHRLCSWSFNSWA